LDVAKVSASVETAFEEAVSRELLAFRADRETIEKIRDFLIEETKKFIEE
jgi:hexokinase